MLWYNGKVTRVAVLQYVQTPKTKYNLFASSWRHIMLYDK